MGFSATGARPLRTAPRLVWQRWLPGATLLTALALVFARRALQQDFAAFFAAGRALSAGHDPYRNDVPALWDGVAVFQHSRFMYSPLFGVVMRLWAALPFGLAKTLFSLGSVACWVGCLHLLTRLLVLRPSTQRWLVATAALWPPVWLTLERGQTDLVALWLLLWAWTERERVWRAGGLFACAVLVKPALGPAIVGLLVARRFRMAGATAAVSAAFVLLGAALAGPHVTGTYFAEVLPRVAVFGEGGTADQLLPDDELTSRDTAFHAAAGSVVLEGHRYLVEPVPVLRTASLGRLLAPSGPNALGGLLPPLLFLAWLFFVFRRRAQHPSAWAALPVAAVITSPAGWAMSLTWALPLAAGTLARKQEDAALSSQATRLAAVAVAGVFVGPWLPGGWVIAGVAFVAAASVVAPAEVNPDEIGREPNAAAFL